MRNLSDELLNWYDLHARDLPWRVSPVARKQGVLPDPYHVWLSEIMLQQTTVATVKSYFQAFLQRWPTVYDLAQADDQDVLGEWAGLGYYARARNLLKCARVIVSDYQGVFPNEYKKLLKLPGIGPYTAGALSSIAFDQPHVVVDGNVERVMARLFDIHTPLPKAKPALTELAKSLTPKLRSGDYAQAVMDLGATICTPRSPSCTVCPWQHRCKGYAKATTEQLPKKTPKKPKPIRHGTVYLAERADGAWLLEKRPDQGLLGGMLGWPSSEWLEISHPCPIGAPPIEGNWCELESQVRHSFTHFHLVLRVMHARFPAQTKGAFILKDAFRLSNLPTVMRKAYDIYSSEQMVRDTRTLHVVKN